MGWYRSVARPVLFRFSPEAAHWLAGTALRLPLAWERVGGVPKDLGTETELAGIRLRNPIGLAAGFDKNCRELRGLGRLGFGYVVGGTVTRSPREGNAKPRIVRLGGRDSMVNSLGLPNDGAAAVAGRLRRLRATCAVLVSLGDEDVEDVVANYELLAPLVDGFELNVSSPNSPFRHGRSDSENEAHLVAVLRELSAVRRRPVFVKLPPFRSARERDATTALAHKAAEGGADGLTCSNTMPVSEPQLASGKGGLSGRELFAETPAIVEHMRRATGLPVNACGGIFSASDARACLDAGAVTVQIYTGLIYEGPGLVGAVAQGLLGSVASSSNQVQDG